MAVGIAAMVADMLASTVAAVIVAFTPAAMVVAWASGVLVGSWSWQARAEAKIENASVAITALAKDALRMCI